jgi:hypothetical protein
MSKKKKLPKAEPLHGSFASQKPHHLPPGWKTWSMGEILGEQHLTKFVEILDRLGGDMDAVQKELKEYLQPFKAEFLARGFSVDYLSYRLPFEAAEMLEKEKKERDAKAAKDAIKIADDIMREHRRSQWN